MRNVVLDRFQQKGKRQLCINNSMLTVLRRYGITMEASGNLGVRVAKTSLLNSGPICKKVKDVLSFNQNGPLYVPMDKWFCRSSSMWMKGDSGVCSMLCSRNSSIQGAKCLSFAVSTAVSNAICRPGKSPHLQVPVATHAAHPGEVRHNFAVESCFDSKNSAQDRAYLALICFSPRTQHQVSFFSIRTT
jgi:hypothetical protein